MALGERDERDARGDLWHRLILADRPHLLDLAIHLLEAEARRERQRAVVGAVHVARGRFEAERSQVGHELEEQGRADTSPACVGEDAR